MSENQKKILEMLAEKKISVDEASRLLSLVEPAQDEDFTPSGKDKGIKTPPKYLRVTVQPGAGATTLESGAERVNIRVPMALIRAGIKLTALIPPKATAQINEALSSKGIDMDVRNIKPEDLEELVEALSDLEVDVEGRETVRVFVE